MVSREQWKSLSRLQILSYKNKTHAQVGKEEEEMGTEILCTMMENIISVVAGKPLKIHSLCK